ncbi:LacI family transcriptional regulator [Microtetraspora sp. NBRC 13810]|uniref:LacI family DNA-binding transcriptional regulator n=1 Tax=Microtetraspora sp. NBRC 13810 TaxID=3030990 RepID=UPI0024A1FCA1|nr:LacI family DNA-binding transcriptional regulator [Microtetraspora sp. NBRC 13810]GLW09283.1 LacI family transcriptional regulator [Microtetraspora sp. NBRC 13810]
MVGEVSDRRRGRRPTMVDVAREAGVALRTVSRVVNQDTTVGPELARRVHAAIAALGYRPDERARQLRLGVSGTLGAAVRRLSHVNPVLRAVEQAARAAGLMVLAASTEDDERLERHVVESMCRRRFDGIVLEPIGEDHAYLVPELSAGLSLVAVDRPVLGLDVDCVISDNAAGIEAAFAHLVRHGHDRIAYIGDDERIYTAHERARAFRSCLTGHGSPQDGMVHTGEVAPERIHAAVRAALGGPAPATAIVTGNASISVEVLRRLGPDSAKVAIVGFDDSELATLLRPDLTVVAQDDTAIGSTAIELLRARIADPSRPVSRVTVPVELLVRGSGEISPVS